jgi:hypothetical protein
MGILLDTGLPVHRRRQALIALADQGGATTWSLLRNLAADEKTDPALRTLAQERLRQATAPQHPSPTTR